MTVEVVVPEDFIGDVISDLNGRSGNIEHMEPGAGGTQEIKAKVPLAEMFGYATDSEVDDVRAEGRIQWSLRTMRSFRPSLAEELVMKMTGRRVAKAMGCGLCGRQLRLFAL